MTCRHGLDHQNAVCPICSDERYRMGLLEDIERNTRQISDDDESQKRQLSQLQRDLEQVKHKLTAVEQRRELFGFLLEKADAAIRLDRLDQAEQHLLEAERLDSTHVALFDVWTDLAVARGDLARAREMIELACRIEPGAARYVRLADLSEPTDRAAILRKAVALARGDKSIAVLLAAAELEAPIDDHEESAGRAFGILCGPFVGDIEGLEAAARQIAEIGSAPAEVLSAFQSRIDKHLENILKVREASDRRREEEIEREGLYAAERDRIRKEEERRTAEKLALHEERVRDEALARARAEAECEDIARRSKKRNDIVVTVIGIFVLFTLLTICGYRAFIYLLMMD